MKPTGFPLKTTSKIKQRVESAKSISISGQICLITPVGHHSQDWPYPRTAVSIFLLLLKENVFGPMSWKQPHLPKTYSLLIQSFVLKRSLEQRFEKRMKRVGGNG